MTLRFCQKCKTLLSPRKTDTKTFLECSNCGWSIEIDNKAFLISKEEITAEQEKGEGVAENKLDFKGYKNICKKCGYDKAEVIDMGIFYSDEDNLILLKCCKCGEIVRIGDKVS